MRASDKGWVRGLVLVVFIVACILIASTDFAGCGDCGGDPERYARLARLGRWCDWHGILLLVELAPCRGFLEWVAASLWNSKVDHGITALVIWQFLSTITFCVCVLLWTSQLCKKSSRYIWSLLLFAASFVVIDYYAYWNFKMYVDYYYMAWVVIGYTCLFYIKSSSKRVRLLSWIVFILAMVHVAFLRRNGAVLLPAYAYFLMADIMPTASWLKRTCWAAVSCAGFYLIVAGLVGAIPCKKTHPEAVMMREDLRIAALMENRLEEYPVHECSACLNGELTHRTLGQYDHPLLLIEDDDELREHYVAQWKNNTRAMLAARLLQILYFYTNGQAQDVVKPWVEEYFPESRKNPVLWEYSGDEKYGKAGTHGWERLVIYLSGGVVLCVLCLCFCGSMLRGGMDDKDMACRHAFRLLVISLVYVGGFILCTPSLDNRYHCMSVILSLYAFSVLICHLGIRIADRRKKS